MLVRNIIQKTVIGTALMMSVLSGSMAVSIATSSNVQALSPDAKCNAYFLTLPAWYNGLAAESNGSCAVVSPKDLGGAEKTQLSRLIWMVALNALQILFQLVAYLAVGFIIYGGFVYLTSAGRSDKITRGREMIQNAVVGLIISFLAIALVAFVGGRIGVG